MRDALGWRFKFGVVTPSVNTCIQPEFDAMRPPGVTNHIARMFIPDAKIEHDAGFHAVIRSIDDALEPAKLDSRDLKVCGGVLSRAHEGRKQARDSA